VARIFEHGFTTKPNGHGFGLHSGALAAKIMGMLVNRHEIGDPGEFARMSDEELDACLAAQGRALGLPEDAIKKMLSRREPSGVVQ
jgi:hypothetical protein